VINTYNYFTISSILMLWAQCLNLINYGDSQSITMAGNSHFFEI